jgi:molybdopterin-containing oxidoreductase family iron-sulfur binding subunit
MEKKYWQSPEEFLADNKSTTIENNKPVPEFSIEGLDESEIKGKSSRRDFLKMLGFSVSAVALVSSCQMPVRNAIPLLNQPEDVTPGVPNFYASTFFDGNEYCSILVKTRENRPIKIEGNNMSSISQGGTSAKVQASVLNLYDDARLKNPVKGEIKANWDSIDKEIVEKLNSLNSYGKKIVLLTSTIISPTTKKLIGEFIAKYPNVEWVTYDAVSYEAIRKAHQLNFGEAILPTYSIDKSKVVVGFNADYLGTWLDPVAFSKQFAKNRSLFKGNKEMSRLYHYESLLSLTGSNADIRFGIKPSEEETVLLNLYNEVAKSTGMTTYKVAKSPVDIKKAAKDLLENKGKSLVISGTNNLNIQLIVNAINNALGNYGNTVSIEKPMNVRQGSQQAMDKLVKKMNAGEIDALLSYNVNPAYDYFDSNSFISGIKKVKLRISFAETKDETASLCNFILPDNNYLESWNDAEPIEGELSIQQPTIQPIFDTRQFQDSLLKWTDISGDFSDYLENNWKTIIGNVANFNDAWNTAKHDGVYSIESTEKKTFDFSEQKLSASAIGNGIEVVLYEKISMGTGKYTNNPWLLEMPDPITTATWDNYICVSTKYAADNNLKIEDVVKINGEIDLPVIVQPGQPENTISIALGFGRTAAGKAGNGIGKNVYSLANKKGLVNLGGTKVTLEKTGETYPLAVTQIHHTMEGRAIARETTLGEYKKNPISGNEQHVFDEKHNTTLYNKIDFDGIQWGMTIDLNTCTGCSNCVIACQAENNVAVIGKEQVKNRRIMHWMRIDRYYSAEEANPDVYHMPVMCQHCDNAPCENVCPVAATNHSNEGLNQMAYNRCIGTRYCVNNCPYKVRRFNWFEFSNNNQFDYNMNSDLGKMVLNPDVIVRQRGVVEKCSLCVQRLQEKKLTAKIENRTLVDGEVQTACSQSCPTNAIQFGNLLDQNSKVNQINKEERMYHLLEHLHTLPSTSYLTKVKNREA